MEEVNKGHKTDNGFHREAYNAVSEEMKEKLGIDIDKNNIYNKYRGWRKIVLLIRDLHNSSGFGWNNEDQMVVEENTVWDDKIAANPDLKVWRTNKTHPRFNDLDYIVGNDTASGKGARTGADRYETGSQYQATDCYYPYFEGLSDFSFQNVGDLGNENVQTTESGTREHNVASKSTAASSEQRSTRKRKVKETSE
eukprot:TRINITY_DN1490_c0_g1_i2.p1 TRINITY_DN1490_c0_g1~~TRINITY_DN1490_c0_g1_i2.p1  ORF type:complete len:196 (-),score=31.31 TRINITY_DN1490_c0_g1_i2:76-663(-)